MPRVEVVTYIEAPPERCFDLARDLRIHAQTTGASRERVVSGPSSGLMEFGDEVTFEATHFGIRQRVTSKVVSYQRPFEFVDEMQKGAFRSFRHVHRFERNGSGTKMTDIFEFESPGLVMGRLANALFLTRYMCRFLRDRGQELKKLAEDANKTGRLHDAP
jgi:ligand-binding SRPBCC domain-containing protein